MGTRGTVHLQVEAGVARLTLDGPKLNALTVGMWRALRQHVEALSADAAIRCAVIAGAGANFAAGADIEEFPQVRRDETSGRAYHLEILGPALDAIRQAPFPVIAAIEGVCVGGGLEVALACDLRIAAEGSRFGIPVAKLGFPLALPELVLLLQQVSPGVAAELLLAGRLYDAAEAQAKGLVQRVVPAQQLVVTVDETVAGILAASPLALRLNKAQIRQVLDNGGRASPAEIGASFGFFASGDYEEGIAAFLAKRPPRFDTP